AQFPLVGVMHKTNGVHSCPVLLPRAVFFYSESELRPRSRICRSAVSSGSRLLPHRPLPRVWSTLCAIFAANPTCNRLPSLIFPLTQFAWQSILTATHIQHPREKKT